MGWDPSTARVAKDQQKQGHNDESERGHGGKEWGREGRGKKEVGVVLERFLTLVSSAAETKAKRDGVVSQLARRGDRGDMFGAALPILSFIAFIIFWRVCALAKVDQI